MALGFTAEPRVWVESSSCTHVRLGYDGFVADRETPGFLWINTPHGTRGVYLYLAPSRSSEEGPYPAPEAEDMSGMMCGEIDSALTCSGTVYIAQAIILGYNGTSIAYDLAGEPVSCYLVRLPVAVKP